MAILPLKRPQISFDCDTTVEEQDLVYVDTNGIMRKAQANSRSTMPAIGWVTRKLSAGRCEISDFALIKDLAGVVQGAAYFVSEDVAGAIQDQPPEDTGFVLQKVGVGLSSDKLLGQIDPSNIVIRRQ